jgi:hypothetical protein
MERHAAPALRDSLRFLQTLDGILRRGHRVRFRADGWSMHPAIRSGEIITVAPLGRAPVHVGDVLLYRNGRGVIAHRLAGVRRSSGRIVELVLRGDAADSCDAPIAPEQVLGRVVTVEHPWTGRRRRVLSRRWSCVLRCALRGAHAVRTTVASLLRPS